MNGVDGNTYLTAPWGAIDFSAADSYGNRCPSIESATAFKFIVKAGDGSTIFDTGIIDVKQNIFDSSTFGLNSYTNGKDIWVVTDIASGQNGSLKNVGDRCGSSFAENDYQQRTIFCVSDGENYQLMIGGINGDKYGNGNGPWMCKTSQQCGSHSENVIEIYYLGSGT